MQSASDSASHALSAAIASLDVPPTDPHAHAHAARRVSRLADDAELTALETPDPTLRASLLNQVSAARRVAASARQSARQRALSESRNALLPPDVVAAAANKSLSGKDGNSSSPAADIAADINAALRRATAVISDEVARSRAAGSVLSDGTRRLEQTSSQHTRMSNAFQHGGRTLRKLRTSELMANVAVVLSFAFFFIAAAYVASRRLGSSTLVTVAIKPGLAVARAPFHVVRAAWRAASSRRAREKGVSSERASGNSVRDDMNKEGEHGRSNSERPVDEAIVGAEHDADNDSVADDASGDSSLTKTETKEESISSEAIHGKIGHDQTTHEANHEAHKHMENSKSGDNTHHPDIVKNEANALEREHNEDTMPAGYMASSQSEHSKESVVDSKESLTVKVQNTPEVSKAGDIKPHETAQAHTGKEDIAVASENDSVASGDHHQQDREDL